MFEIYKKINSVVLSSVQINIKLLLLSEHLQKKISSYLGNKKKQQRIDGLALLATALKNHKINENAINLIYYNSFGKPFINTEIDFSISYSNNTTVLGFIKKGSIGVDVERIRTVDCTLFKDYFSLKEWEFMSQNSFNEVVFFKLWTRKEAVVKAIGKGVFIELNLVEVLQDFIIIDDKKLYLTTEFTDEYCLSVANTEIKPTTPRL